MNILVTRRRRLVSVAFILVILVAMIFIGIFSTENKSNLDHIKVGYIPITHCIPLYIAIEKGIFAREGIKVDLIALPGGPKILEALIVGEVDVGFSNVVSVILARSNGIKMLPIAGGAIETNANKDHAILIKKDSAISSAIDLKGKKIAINSRQNIDHLMIKAYLDKHALTESHVNLVEIPFPRMNAALEGGLVDAIATVEPFITLGFKEYNRKILTHNYIEVRDRTFVTTFAVMERNLQSNPSRYKRFSRAIKEASKIANHDADISRSVLPAYTGITPSLAEDVGLPYFSPLPDKTNIIQTEEMMITQGFIRQNTDLVSELE
uniref:NitT/TauT family transport system substrate-binding protein n=1 Tax=Candidatus Kentrum sp. TUN TaxID=2126343 RepID=A0A450ZEB0_9GAMM|nr:MAG: NitT/TauT family transport system substrate-binding protein [Candidatus Kentron sp. TUN]